MTDEVVHAGACLVAMVWMAVAFPLLIYFSLAAALALASLQVMRRPMPAFVTMEI